MFSFINGTFLTIAAAGALVPLLIHLIWRNRAIRMPFAAMQFLLSDRKPVSQWLRLRQLLLLLLRMLIAALLAVAFARPFFPDTSETMFWSSVDREIGIALDVSASMSAADHAEKAQAALSQLLNELEDTVPVTVALSGSTNPVVAERVPITAALRQQIKQRLVPGFQAGNLREALQSVDQVLAASPASQKELYVISDFQKSDWPTYSDTLNLASNARVALRPVAEEPFDNIFISEITLPDGQQQSWACRVENENPSGIKSAKVSLHLGGKQVGKKSVNFNGAKSKIVTFKVRKQAKGRQIAGHFAVEASGDQLDADNTHYFILNQQQTSRILVVNGEPSRGAADELYYIRRALGVKNSPFSYRETSMTRADGLDLAAFDLIVLANVKGLNHRSLAGLTQFVKRGGGLVLAPGDRVEPALFNKFFGELSPASLIAAKGGRSTSHKLVVNQPQHQLFTWMAASGQIELGNATWSRYWQVQLAENASRLASLTNAAPAIIEKNFGLGAVIFLNFPLDAEWSNFALQPGFLPFLHELCNYLQTESRSRRDQLVRQPVVLSSLFETSEPIAVTLPEGTTQSLDVATGIYSDTDSPGIYTFAQAGKQHHIAVNLAASESAVELELPERFNARLVTNAAVTSIDKVLQAGALTDLETENRQKVWRVLLFVCLLLILIESAFANRVPR